MFVFLFVLYEYRLEIRINKRDVDDDGISKTSWRFVMIQLRFVEIIKYVDQEYVTVS